MSVVVPCFDERGQKVIDVHRGFTKNFLCCTETNDGALINARSQRSCCEINFHAEMHKTVTPGFEVTLSDSDWVIYFAFRGPSTPCHKGATLSGSPANLLKAHDTIMALDLPHGELGF
ncbi:hypothetical protein L1987_57024 [Smallanthus sonchifolius]|uniref:Uncharacterized protein n=1 Tax=Smallanthus sonchifolius TaxID=185202 RepID=A0ACB9DCC8_9ASTR|nr:hypothetical protein L1987_57024 [Smallanthus sonchifolius]